MNTKLVSFLIQNFTKEGDTVLDPMAGSGCLGVISALHGRNAVQVELEKKFFVWMEEAKRKVEASPSLTAKGSILNILGDARKLSELLKQADVILTSPPYSGTLSEKAGGGSKKNVLGIGIVSDGKKQAQGAPAPYSITQKNIGNLVHGEISAVITSPPHGDSFLGGGDPEKRKERLEKAGHDPKDFLGGQARNAVLKHYDEVDAVITSPPYAESAQDSKESPCVAKPARKGDIRQSPRKPPISRYSESEANIGNLPFEPDAIITSPPYEASVSDDKEGPLAGGNEEKYGKWKKGTARKHSYTQEGEPCKVDAVITSPPYEGSLEGSTRHTRGGIASRDPALAQTGTYATRLSFGVPVGYSPDKENIGNLKSDDKEYEALADAIITSPPYEDSYQRTSADLDGKMKRLKELGAGESSEGKYHNKGSAWYRVIKAGKAVEGFAGGYLSENPNQIGSMKKETYLEAMFKCYEEMHKVLKPNGLCIIVVKAFIRNKQVVDLPYHTWLLLEKVGFKLVKLFKLRLQQQSFWRILYKKRFPTVPEIKHEYVLVCQKL